MKTSLKLKKLIIRNFMSYGNDHTEINLDFNKPVLVMGKNHDAMVNGLIDSNGAGKTTILNAITWVLFDKTLSKIDKNDLINNDNKKNLEITIEFEKNNKFYKIHRYRKNKALGGDGAQIIESNNSDFKDAKDIAQDKISLINKQIEDIIDIPFDVFNRIFVFTHSNEDFFSLPATSTKDKNNQRDIIEEICGYTEISKKSKVLKLELDDHKKDLKRLEELNDTILQQKNKIEEQINLTKVKKDEWDKNNNLEIDNLRNEIKRLKNINFAEEFKIYDSIKSLNNDINSINHNVELLKKEIQYKKDNYNKAVEWEGNNNLEIEKIEKTIKEFDGISFDNEEEKLKNIEKLINKIKDNEKQLIELSDINQLEKDIKKYKNEILDLKKSICPYCKQEYKESIDKIEKIESNVDNLEKEFSKTYKMKNDLEKNILKLNNEKNQIECLYSNLRELDSKKSEFISLLNKLEELRNNINPYKDINLDDIKNDINQLEIKILNDEKNKKEKTDKITNMEVELTHITEDQCISEFNKMEFLINKLKDIKNEINPYIEALNDLSKLQIKETKASEIDILKDTINHIDFLYKLLTKKDSFIRKALLNKKIPFLNKRLNIYLSKLGLPHKVEFTEEMTASISQFGKIIPYHNLSNGQKARLNLSLSLAFKDVLESRYGKISFCIMDECLDVGLGSVGVQLAAKMLKEISTQDKISMFIISHRDEIANQFDDILLIELKNKFSHISYMQK